MKAVEERLNVGDRGVRNYLEQIEKSRENNKKHLRRFGSSYDRKTFIKDIKKDIITNEPLGMYITKRDDIEGVELYPSISEFKSYNEAYKAFKELKETQEDEEYDYLNEE